MILRIAAVLACAVALTSCSDGSSDSPPFADVRFISSYAHQVRILDCPCFGGNIVLPGAPGSDVGEGSALGVTVKDPAPLVYHLKVNGRAVVCAPPKPVEQTTARGPGPLYQLTYDITPDGRCIVLRW